MLPVSVIILFAFGIVVNYVVFFVFYFILYILLFITKMTKNIRFAFLYYYQTQRDYLHSKRKKLNLAKYAFLNSSRNSFNFIQYLC